MFGLAPLRILAGIAGTAVTSRPAVDNPSVGQSHAPGIDQVRSVLRQVAIHHERVPQLDVAALEAAPRQSARSATLASPARHVALFVLYIKVKVRMRIR